MSGRGGGSLHGGVAEKPMIYLTNHLNRTQGGWGCDPKLAYKSHMGDLPAVTEEVKGLRV